MHLSFRGFVVPMAIATMAMSSVLRADDPLRTRLGDEQGVRTDVWVYNDIAAATEQARREDKPLFVTFRCVPCKACAAFDADVANGNELVRAFAKDKFVAVRQVEMKNVDLSLFEFDHDLNWAAMFVNADGVVYARYGTQSAEGPDAFNSIEGLLNTMRRVLELHAAYPGNLDELRGKRGTKPPGTMALELPGMQNAEKLEKETTRSNCIHCHMVHDAQHFQAQETGTFTRDQLWKFPLPDNVGLKIDPDSGVRVEEVVAGSPAEKAGLSSGDEVVRMNGQRITSIADMQWVLHGLPHEDASLDVEVDGGVTRALALQDGWKEHDISWRGSIWSVSPRLNVWAPTLTSDRQRALGIGESETAFLVKWINRAAPGGRSAFDCGLRENDVIVALEGDPLPQMTPAQFNLHIKLNYKVGDELPVTVVRDGERHDVRIRLAE
jgi:hypothetical protein